MTDNILIKVEALHKHFILHTQAGVSIPVLEDVSFELKAGECLVLDGPSGAGKSTLLRCLYANYSASAGSIAIRAADSAQFLDITQASPQQMVALRRTTLSYVSQFLRVIPRVSSRDIVAQPVLDLGAARSEALASADALLSRLNLPERLWHLPPATFSGGEQQRVNIARGFIAHKAVLLLDEPTASLDAANRQVVLELIREERARGTGIVGIFHDAEVREAVSTRRLAVHSVALAA